MGKVLILDGDSIAYRCAAAGEKRSVIATRITTGVFRSFKHRTELKEKINEWGVTRLEDYSVIDHQEPEPLNFVLSTIKNHITRIVSEVNPSKIEIFCGESDNFRKKLLLPFEYKGNRKGLRPVHLQDVKRYLQQKYEAKQAISYEVDDACCIAAYDAIRAGDEAVMYYYEKDQLQLDGVTLLFDDEDGFRYEKVPELGSLRKEKSGIKGYGLKFLAYQWMCSDPVDTYCAYDLSKQKSGPLAVYKLLVNCQSIEEVLVAVREEFKRLYPDFFEYTDCFGNTQYGDHLSMMSMYYKCCYMMRSKDDTSDCQLLFNKHGVSL